MMPPPPLLAVYAEMAIAKLAVKRPDILDLDPITLRRRAIEAVMAEFRGKPPVSDPE